MKSISFVELRTNSEAVVKELKAGKTLVLTYRGKQLAELKPIRDSGKRSPETDPLFDIERIAQPSPLGPLNHSDIDSLLYE